MNFDSREFEGQAFCSVLEGDVHVARGMRSKSGLRCTGTGWYLWEYRLGYSLLTINYGARARAGGTCLVAVLHAASVIGCWGCATGAASIIVCW